MGPMGEWNAAEMPAFLGVKPILMKMPVKRLCVRRLEMQQR